MSSKFKSILDRAKDREPETTDDETPPPSPCPGDRRQTSGQTGSADG